MLPVYLDQSSTDPSPLSSAFPLSAESHIFRCHHPQYHSPLKTVSDISLSSVHNVHPVTPAPRLAPGSRVLRGGTKCPELPTSDQTHGNHPLCTGVQVYRCTGVQVYNRWPPEPHRDRTFMASLVPLISRGEVGDYCWKSEVVCRQRDDAYQEHLHH